MNYLLLFSLKGSAQQTTSFYALQQTFAQVCNALAPLVQQTRCWNRFTLHHLAYKPLRKQFPVMVSQMICNAIYSVSRSSRLVYQHPDSPFNLNRLGDKPLPLLRFADTCPVYFDRHTLSVKDGQLSMYTLDGRIRLHLDLRPKDEASFHEDKLREIVLSRTATGGFDLSILFSTSPQDDEISAGKEQTPGEIPDYVTIDETP